MADVRTRLNSHPIPTLRKILSATAKFVNIKGGFSRTLKTKKDIVDYMIELEKDMPEVSWDKIPLKDKPKKEKAPPKKEKAPPKKPSVIVDVEKATKAGIKIDKEKAKKAGVKLIEKPKAKPKRKLILKADVNCNKAKNNSQSIISLYEKHGGVIKNSDFSSRKDLNEAIELVNTFVNDSRCNANEKAIMKKALKSHAENPKAKAKVPKKLNIL